MTAELELTVLHDGSDELGCIAGFAVTDRMILATGGTTDKSPTVLASSNARRFEPRPVPRATGTGPAGHTSSR